MAHLQQTVKSFGDNFTSTFQQSNRLAQEESQFIREQDFKNRQLTLRDAFRRDQLDEIISRNQTLSDYYDNLNERGIATGNLNRQKAENEFLFRGIFEVDEDTPEDAQIIEAFDKTYEVPRESIKPVEQARFVRGPFGTQVEQKYTVNPDGEETILNYETVISPSTDNNKPVDISNEVGEANKYIEIFKEFERRGLSDTDKITIEINGETQEIDKSTLRANAKRYTTDILNKVGIDSQGDFMHSIRVGAGVPTYGKNQWDSFSDKQKRDIRNKAKEARFKEIDKRRANGELTEQVFIALRYWAILGSM